MTQWESKDGEIFNHTGSQRSDWVGLAYAESVWTELEQSIEVAPRKSLLEQFTSWVRQKLYDKLISNDKNKADIDTCSHADIAPTPEMWICPCGYTEEWSNELKVTFK